MVYESWSKLEVAAIAIAAGLMFAAFTIETTVGTYGWAIMLLAIALIFGAGMIEKRAD